MIDVNTYILFSNFIIFLQSKELGRPATLPELHVHLHTHKSNRSQFVDKKSQDVYVSQFQFT